MRSGCAKEDLIGASDVACATMHGTIGAEIKVHIIGVTCLPPLLLALALAVHLALALAFSFAAAATCAV